MQEFAENFRASIFRFLVPVLAGLISFYLVFCVVFSLSINPGAVFILCATGAAFGLSRLGFREFGLSLFLGTMFAFLWWFNYPSATQINGFVSGKAYIICLLPIVWWMSYPHKLSRWMAVIPVAVALVSIAVAGQPENSPFRVPDSIVYVGLFRAIFIIAITMSIGHAIELSIKLFERRWKESFAEQDALRLLQQKHTADLEREAAAHKETMAHLSRSETRYRRLFDNAFDGIILYEVETGKAIEINDTFCDKLGYSKEELFKLDIFELSPTHQADGRTTSEVLQEVLENTLEAKDSHYVWQHLSKSGELIDFEIYSFPIPGEASKRVSILRDVTTQQKTAQALIEANLELSSFAHAASHDLKEPLRTMSSFAKLIANRYSEKLDEEGREYVEYITEAAARGTTLVSDLLQFAELGTDQVSTRVVSLNGVAATVQQIVRTRLAEENATLTVDDLPKVIATPTWAQQLLQNLISNALKFKREGVNPEVHVFAKTVGSFHEIHVKDNGIGIAEENLERVFGVFERLNVREDYEGNGIGLALCQRIMKKLGGSIRVESNLGTGTTFTLSFPHQDAVNAQTTRTLTPASQSD